MSEGSDSLSKLRQLTTSLPAFSDTQCLELGMYEDVGRVINIDMFDDDDVNIRRAFVPKGKGSEDYSQNGMIELAVVYHGKVIFETERFKIECGKGGATFIFPGESVSIEGLENSWVLFTRMLSPG